jgi:PTH1 family peptidyl-tRNA hydrolase
MNENLPLLIVGLGNPGRDYKENRHNVGFMLIDRLAVRLNARNMKVQSKAIVISTQLDGKKLLLAKPQTYMNLSGTSALGLLHFYKLPIENFLVAHDDLDLPFGSIRIRPGGGPGGQKGVEDIINRLGTQDYARLRIGIDRPPGRMDPANYVLQDFPARDLIALSQILDRAADSVQTWIRFGLDTAMNKFNGSIAL